MVSGVVAAAALLLLLGVDGAAGLRCYACVPNRAIAGATLPKAIRDKTQGFPRCSDMKTGNPGLHFEMHCPPGLDKSCVKIRDDHGNELRSCFSAPSSKCTTQSKKGQVLCMCRGDFCNAAPTGQAPALTALFVPLTAALLRLH